MMGRVTAGAVFLVGMAAGCVGMAAVESHGQSYGYVPDVPALIDRAAGDYGLSAWARQRARRIAWCESRFQPYVVNRRSGAIGVFQFLPSTAAAIGINPWDAEQNVYGAIQLMSHGEWSHWRGCW